MVSIEISYPSSAYARDFAIAVSKVLENTFFSIGLFDSAIGVIEVYIPFYLAACMAFLPKKLCSENRNSWLKQNF